MIGLLLAFFAGKFYYDLAKEYGKNTWLYAISGVACYYGGQFLAGMIIAILVDFVGVTWIDLENNLALGLMGLPVGILVCFLVYKALSKRLVNAKEMSDDNLLDDDHI